MEIAYRKLSFKEPLKLTEARYNEYKSKIVANDYFEIEDGKVSFFRFFLKRFIAIGVGFLMGPPIATWAGSSGIKGTTWELVLYAPASFLIIFAIAGVVKFALEILPYISYSMNRHSYFEKMRVAIKNTSNYNSFVLDFYPINSSKNMHLQTFVD